MLHNYSKYSSLAGLIGLCLFTVSIFEIEFRKAYGYIGKIAPTLFFILSIFIAKSTMTVAFMYFAINIFLISKNYKNFKYFFQPTLFAIYFFAGLNKLSPAFRSGDVLKIYLPEYLLEYRKQLAIAAIITEIYISITVLLQLNHGKYIALILSISILILLPTDTLHFFNLFIYQAAMIISMFLLFQKNGLLK
jgi:hypothetical protein